MHEETCDSLGGGSICRKMSYETEETINSTVRASKLFGGESMGLSSRKKFKLVGPGFSGKNYEVICEYKNLPLFSHLMLGFPAENLKIISVRPLGGG